MNIFILDEDIKKNAEYHCDRHVVKMILEYAQLASTAHHLTGSIGPYKSTHENHPCALWARENIENYRYLVELGLALCEEYSYRYEKTHKTEEILIWLKENEPNLPLGDRTPFALAMPDLYKNPADPVASYRSYYTFEKYNLFRWKNREEPYWVMRF